MRYDRLSKALTAPVRQLSVRGVMAKLLFDALTYQFYYRCRSEEIASAIAAGFGWDPIRRRYCTDDPTVAMSLAEYGDAYVKRLLADVVETVGAPANRKTGYCERQTTRYVSNTLH